MDEMTLGAAIKRAKAMIDGSTPAGGDTVDVEGSAPVITAQASTTYRCGTVSTLDFTPCVDGLCAVRFGSGSTATVLTVPSSVLWPAWFDKSNLESGRTYEISVADGVYGAVISWPLT